MLQELLQFDKEFFIYLNGLGTPQWDNLFQFISHKLSAVPLYIFLLILSYQKFGLKRTLVLLISVAFLITVTDQLSNFFKYGVARLRPCHDPEIIPVMRLVKSYCGGQYGYFSAHAANAFAIVVFFGSILKFVQQYPRVCKIKDGKTRVILIVESIDSVDKAINFLKEILKIKSLQMQ